MFIVILYDFIVFWIDFLFILTYLNWFWIAFDNHVWHNFVICYNYIIIMLYNFKFISNSFDFIWNSIGIHLECWLDVVKIVWNVMNFGVNLTEMMDSSLILDWMRENHLLSANGLSISESVLAASLVRFPMLPLERQARILPLTWKMWFRFW